MLGLIASLKVYATSEHPTNASHPAARSRQIQKPQRQSLPQDQQDSTGLQRPLMVDSAIQCSPREVICSAATSINPNHGCIQGWMGSTLGRHTGIRHVASFSGKEAHQPSRAMGHPPDPSTPSTSSQGQNGSSEVRHVGGHVHQQKGRSPQQVPVPSDNSPAQVVLAVSDNTPSGAPTGGGKQVGQCTVQESVVNPGQAENPGVVSGVAPESDRVSNAVQPPAKTSHRPICQQSQQATSNLPQLGCRSDFVRSGCNGNQLGHDSGLCLPSDCSHPQSAGEDRQLQVMRHDPDSSKVASAAVVPETHLSPSRRSDGPSDPQGPHPDRRRSPSPSSDSSSAESDCMANFIKSYTEAGLSSKAAAIAGEARRPSTRLTYNSCIRKYFKWCRQAAINPHSASLGQVCDFLTAVLKEEGATAHSVRSCRTAVAAVHHGFGEGNTVSNSPAIQDLIKGMFHQRPPTKSLVPSWDLPTALRFWAEPPFEPLHQANLMDLTRKTVFLVAAACGRRVSEIQALSVAENHIRWSSNAVHLLPRAGFLAKNQTLDFIPKHIILPDLRKASGSPDCGPWCPVQALKFYINRTAPYRGEVDSSFLTVNKPIKKASKQTMSRWIVSVIKESISVEDLKLTDSRIRAHDVRSQAGAWALYKGCSIQDIMEAQGWSSPTTFQNVYLKDVLVPTATRVLSTAGSSSTMVRRC